MAGSNHVAEWESVAVHQNFAQFREPLLEGLKSITESLYRESMEGRSILDVGSGLFGLSELVPRASAQVQLSDAVPSVVEERKRRQPGSNIVVGDLYDLPFRDKSFDCVFGYGVFDVLHDLPAAVRECRRVLRPGGRLIAVLDLQANLLRVLERHMSPQVTLLPRVTRFQGRTAETGFDLVSRAELEQQEVHLSGHGRIANEMLKSLPTLFYADPSAAQIRREAAAEYAQLDLKTRKAIDWNDDFASHLDSTLRANGFRVTSSGLRKVVLPASPTLVQRYPGSDVYFRPGVIADRVQKTGTPMLHCEVLVEVGEVISEE